MGGEWWFNFILEKKDTFDLKAYQKLLPEWRAEFEPKFQAAKYDFQAFWCPSEAVPPEDNIYARFTYHCTKPGNWSNPNLVWYLFWDPTILPVTDYLADNTFVQSKLFGKTGPYLGISSQLQKRVKQAFWEHFDYENDYLNDYYDVDSAHNKDLTACDKECGYCGKCPY